MLRFVCLFMFSLGLVQSAFAFTSDTQKALMRYDCLNGDKSMCDALYLADPTEELHEVTSEYRNALVENYLTKKRADCEAKDIRACVSVGAHLQFQNVSHFAEAYGIFADACDVGDGWACHELWQLNKTMGYLSNSHNVDFSAFYKAQANSCEHGDQDACTSQARLNVLLNDVTPDRKIWHDQLVTACDDGQGRACGILSYIYGYGGTDEYGVFDPSLRENLRKSFRYARKACDRGNATGCFNAGLSYLYGDGVAENWELGQHYVSKACKLGFRTGCEEMISESFWRAFDPLPKLENACLGFDLWACTYASHQRHKPSVLGPKTEEDITRMASFRSDLRDICEKGLPMACSDAAVHARRAGDLEEAERYGDVACDFGEGPACTTVANLLKNDRGGEENLKKSILYYDQACELESWAGCNNLGHSFQHGLGVEQSNARAERLYALACSNRLALGCNNLAKLYAKTAPEKEQGARARACDLEKKFCVVD